ncbi:hypothetical protein FNF28_04770 [Cafeteria roenbergensis]|uniref:GPI inositol-deacylase n=2 Tax=Cafeteria roenbergensis TaxID=33653 RepID=A0A5A8DEK8_CAFRO|nr:hypothetical protein FNF28_04770 [Cafeteria roenbergensis]
MGATLRFWRRHWMVQLTGVAVLLTGWASLSVRQLPVSPPSQCIEFQTAPAQFEIPVNITSLPKSDPFSFDPSLGASHRLVLLRAAGERPPPEGLTGLPASFVNDCLRRICALYGTSVRPVAGAADDPAFEQASTLERCAAAGGVLLVAHSMGGVASRLAMVLPNHPAGAVQSLITLNTPHQAHPFTADEAMAQLYQQLNGVWSAAAIRGSAGPAPRRDSALGRDASPSDEASASQPAARGPPAEPPARQDWLQEAERFIRTWSTRTVFAVGQTVGGSSDGVGPGGQQGAGASDLPDAAVGLSTAQWDALSGVVVASLTGGTTDMTIRPELSSLTGLVSPVRAATGMTEGLVGAWLRTTHQDIAWCGQASASWTRLAMSIQDVPVSAAGATAAASGARSEGASSWPHKAVFGRAGGRWQASPAHRVVALRALLSPPVDGTGAGGVDLLAPPMRVQAPGTGQPSAAAGGRAQGAPNAEAARTAHRGTDGAYGVGGDDGSALGESSGTAADAGSPGAPSWRPLPRGAGMRLWLAARSPDDAASLPRASQPTTCFARHVSPKELAAALHASGRECSQELGARAGLSVAERAAWHASAAAELVTDLPRGPAGLRVAGHLRIHRPSQAPGASAGAFRNATAAASSGRGRWAAEDRGSIADASSPEPAVAWSARSRAVGAGSSWQQLPNGLVRTHVHRHKQHGRSSLPDYWLGVASLRADSHSGSVFGSGSLPWSTLQGSTVSSGGGSRRTGGSFGAVESSQVHGRSLAAAAASAKHRPGGRRAADDGEAAAGAGGASQKHAAAPQGPGGTGGEAPPDSGDGEASEPLWQSAVPLASGLAADDYGSPPASLEGQPARCEAMSLLGEPIARPREFRHFAEEGAALAETGTLSLLRVPWHELLRAPSASAPGLADQACEQGSDAGATLSLCVEQVPSTAGAGSAPGRGEESSAAALAAGEAAHDMDGWTIGPHYRSVVLTGMGWVQVPSSSGDDGGPAAHDDAEARTSASTAAKSAEAAAAALADSGPLAAAVRRMAPDEPPAPPADHPSAPSSDLGVARWAAWWLSVLDAAVAPRGWILRPGRPAFTRINLPDGLTPAMEYGVTLTATCPAVGDPASGETATGAPSFFPVVTYSSSGGSRDAGGECVGCETRVLPWAAGSALLDGGTVPPAVEQAIWRTRSLRDGAGLAAAGLPPPRVTLHRLTTHTHGVIHWWGGGEHGAEPSRGGSGARRGAAWSANTSFAAPPGARAHPQTAGAADFLHAERLPAALSVLADPSCTYTVALVPDLASFPARWLRLRALWLVSAFVTVIAFLLAAQTREWAVRRQAHRLALKQWLRRHRKSLDQLQAAARRAQVAHAAACEMHIEASMALGAEAMRSGTASQGTWAAMSGPPAARAGPAAAGALALSGSAKRSRGGPSGPDSPGFASSAHVAQSSWQVSPALPPSPEAMLRESSAPGSGSLTGTSASSESRGSEPWGRQRATTVDLLLQGSEAEAPTHTPTQMAARPAPLVMPGLSLPGPAGHAQLEHEFGQASGHSSRSGEAVVSSAVAAGAAALATHMPASVELPTHPLRAHFPSLHYTASRACGWVALLCFALSLVVSLWGGAIVPPEPWLAIPGRDTAEQQARRAARVEQLQRDARGLLSAQRGEAVPRRFTSAGSEPGGELLVGVPTEWLPPSAGELFGLYTVAYAMVCCCCLVTSVLVDLTRVVIVATALLDKLARDGCDSIPWSPGARKPSVFPRP